MKVVFYDTKGLVVRDFDYSHDGNEREFTTAECSPSGQSLVVGSYNRSVLSLHIQSATDSARSPIRLEGNSGRREN